MQIREIDNQFAWDEYVTSMPEYTPLQGWQWGEFSRVRGERAWRFGIFEGTEQLGCAQVVSVTARRGKFLFIPHGPLLKKWDGDTFSHFVQYLKQLARKEGYSFIRISPWIEATKENKKIFSHLGFNSSPSYMHAEETWLLPLEKDEKKLLVDMRKTTRNLINRAQRDGVEIVKSKNPEDLKILLDLQAKTAERHEFVPFSDAYLEKEFSIFSEGDHALIFLGKHKEIISSAALIIFYGKGAFYFQSGSVKSDAPVSYLLQWEVIREAKERGCTVYNLWGVAPENNPNHKWAGLTLFKSGFGGHRKDYMHAQDLPLSKKYWLAYIAEKLPRTLRARTRKTGK